MRKIIHHLRRQPEEVRTHVLHILTFVAAVILFFLWIFSLGSKGIVGADRDVKIAEDAKPFSALKANLIGGYESLQDSPTPTLEQ